MPFTMKLLGPRTGCPKTNYPTRHIGHFELKLPDKQLLSQGQAPNIASIAGEGL